MKNIIAGLCVVLAVAIALAQAPKAKRINRAIELLEQGQPIYYTGSHSGTSGSYEQGVKDAQTYADYINYDMEHAPFDVKGLADYMRGLSQDEYRQKADAWPLNPNGELLLGLKLEDKYALANAEENARVPGIAFAEWGPGDMALSLGVRANAPEMLAARAKVFAACKANKLFFLNSMNAKNVIELIQEGVMIGPANQQAAEIGRKYTNRAMPW